MVIEGWLMMESEDVLAEMVDREDQLGALHGRIAHRFSSSESQQRL